MDTLPVDCLQVIAGFVPDAQTFRAFALTCRKTAKATRRSGVRLAAMDRFAVRRVDTGCDFATVLPDGRLHGLSMWEGSSCWHVDGLLHGTQVVCYPTECNTRSVSEYDHGIPVGTCAIFREDGSLDTVTTYENGTKTFMIKYHKGSDVIMFRWSTYDGTRVLLELFDREKNSVFHAIVNAVGETTVSGPCVNIRRYGSEIPESPSLLDPMFADDVV